MSVLLSCGIFSVTPHVLVVPWLFECPICIQTIHVCVNRGLCSSRCNIHNGLKLVVCVYVWLCVRESTFCVAFHLPLAFYAVSRRFHPSDPIRKQEKATRKTLKLITKQFTNHQFIEATPWFTSSYSVA